MSDVTQRSSVPRFVMMASHIATSAAPIVMPLTMPQDVQRRRKSHVRDTLPAHG
jgi:hypothetical protein